MVVHCPHCRAELQLIPTKAKMAPCAKCGASLNQRQRMRPCAKCGYTNWREVEADRKARKAAKEALLDPRIRKSE